MITESLAKYLAGLMDADGCLTLQLKKSTDGEYRAYMKMSIFQADVTDRVGLIESLPILTGMGRVCRASTTGGAGMAGCCGNSWEVWKIEHLNKLIPRIAKHMVIKGKHWARIHDLFLNLRGQALSDKDRETLRAAVQSSRNLDAGPIKPKKHPTWGWVAGIMDGDGSYTHKKKTRTYLSHGVRKSCEYYVTRAQITLHENDRVAIDLLAKAFGGGVYQASPDSPHIIQWVRNLGPRDSSFAKRFLSKVVQHSRIKRHKIEKILSYHNQLQRLSEQGPKG